MKKRMGRPPGRVTPHKHNVSLGQAQHDWIQRRRLLTGAPASLIIRECVIAAMLCEKKGRAK